MQPLPVQLLIIQFFKKSDHRSSSIQSYSSTLLISELNQIMVIFEQLPEDVAEMILLRLPVKSLSRFKCVSKSWCAAIRHPRFIAKHITFNNNRGFLFASRLINRLPSSQVLSFLSYQTFEAAGTVVHNLNKIQGNRDLFVQISGPCNGIFCLFDGNDSIALWNPAIKELRVLPPSDVTPPPNAGTMDTCVGFGCDDSQDYKVLVFKHLCSNSANTLAHAELYTMSSDSWKLIRVEDEFQPIGNLPISAFNPSIDGVFSWFEIDDNVDKVIYSFDTSKEAFTKTHLPDYGIPSRCVHGKLVSFNDSLTFIHDYPLGETSKGFDVWVLGEYGVKESWTKYLTIGPLSGVEVPLGFSKSGELLFENKGELICWDRITETTMKLKVSGAKNTLRVCHYQESLVSVKREQKAGGRTVYLQGLRFNFDPFINLKLNANVL